MSAQQQGKGIEKLLAQEKQAQLTVESARKDIL
jgi:hypothetical protein